MGGWGGGWGEGERGGGRDTTRRSTGLKARAFDVCMCRCAYVASTAGMPLSHAIVAEAALCSGGGGGGSGVGSRGWGQWKGKEWCTVFVIAQIFYCSQRIRGRRCITVLWVWWSCRVNMTCTGGEKKGSFIKWFHVFSHLFQLIVQSPTPSPHEYLACCQFLLVSNHSRSSSCRCAAV